jgi:hypothetical protein
MAAIPYTQTTVTNGGVQTWIYWNQAYIATTSTSTNFTIQGGTVWQTWNLVYEDTEDQIRQRRELHERIAAEQELARQQYAESQRLAAAAETMAGELLNELLSDVQQRTLAEHGWFDVRGSESGRTYRIRPGCVNNVDRLTEDQTKRERIFCAHPPGLPDSDIHLAQMLLLVTDEPAFLEVANSHPVAGYEAEVITLPVGGGGGSAATVAGNAVAAGGGGGGCAGVVSSHGQQLAAVA